MSLLSYLISPKKIFGVIRSQIESSLNDYRKTHTPDAPPIVVSSYLMEVDVPTKQINFFVKRNKYPFDDGGTFCNLLTQQAAEYIDDGTTIEKIVVHYSPGMVKVVLGYVDKDNNKLSKTQLFT